MSFGFMDEGSQASQKPWMEDKTYELIREGDECALLDYVEDVIDHGYCAIDLETEGFDNRVSSEGKTPHDIVGYCLSYDGEEGVYIPVKHSEQIGHVNEFRRTVEEQIERICEECVTIYHNSKFDLEFLYGTETGIQVDDPEQFEDTLILSYLKDPTQHQHGLKYLSNEILDQKMIEFNELFPGEQDESKFGDIELDRDDLLWYAGSDAICTYQLWEQMRDIPKRENMEELYRIEKNCVIGHRWMERNRPKLDKQYLERLNRQMRDEIHELKKDIYASIAVGLEDSDQCEFDQDTEQLARKIRNGDDQARIKIERDYDIDSPKKLGTAIEHMVEAKDGLDIDLKETDTGQVATDEETIENLSEEYGSTFPFLDKIGTFRNLRKVKSTYVKPLLEEGGDWDGRLEDHTTRFKFNAYGTDSGRFSANKGKPEQGSSGINIQSMPGCYNGATFPAKKVHDRPDGPGDEHAELYDDYLYARDEQGLVRHEYDEHFIEDLRTGDEYCLRDGCEGCPFQEECNHDEPEEKRFLSLGAAVRPAIVPRDGYVMAACVKEGSLVPIRGQGLVPIEDVCEGQYTKTEKGWCEIEHAQKTGEKECITIRTEKGFEIDVTQDHKIRTTDEEGGLIWKEAQDMEEGDWIVQAGNHVQDSNQAPPLPDKVSIDHHGTHEMECPDQLTPKLSQFLGRFMGDGHIGHDPSKRNVSHIGVSLGDDAEELFPIIEERFYDLFGSNVNLNLKEDDSGDAVCWSTNLAQWLEKITRKHEKSIEEYEVPDCILQSNRECMSAFLSGLFDADGSVCTSKGGTVRLYITSDLMAKQVQNMLLGLGISIGRRKIERSTNFGYADGWELRVAGIQNLNRFYREIGTDSPRKDEQLSQLMSRERARDITDLIPLDLARQAVNRQRHSETNNVYARGRKNGRVTRECLNDARPFEEDTDEEWMEYLLDKDLHFDQIKEVEEHDRVENVYDLTVPESNQFQADGVVVHNCDYSSLEIRAAAEIADEEAWKEEFIHGEGDAHKKTAKLVYGDDVVNKPDYKMHRQKAKCVTGDTLVQTSKGLLPIEDLDPGSEPDEFVEFDNPLDVWTDEGIHEATHFYNGGVQDTIEITTKNKFRLEGSETHRIRVYDKDEGYTWRELQNVSEGDYVVLDRGGDLFPDEQYQAEFDPFYPDPAYQAKSENRPKIPMTEDWCYYLGILTSDGSLSKSEVRVHYNPKEKEWEKNFCKLLDRLGLKYNKSVKREKESASIRVSSRRLRRTLERWGTKRKSVSATIPDVILRSNKKGQLAFLQGLFDGDGTVNENGYVSYSSASNELLSQVQTILASFGIFGTIHKGSANNPITNRDYYKVTMYGQEAVRFGERIGFRLDRKDRRIATSGMTYDKIPWPEQHIEEDVPHNLDEAKDRQGLTYNMIDKHRDEQNFPDEIFWLRDREVRITKVEDVKEKTNQVYDLTVPGPENFWGNGFINHNSSNFAILYQGGGNAIARSVGVSKDEGWDIHNKVKKGLSSLKEWEEKTIHKAHQQEYVRTCLNRKIPLDGINSSNEAQVAALERKATNSVIQGSATGDLIKYAMGEVHDAVHEKGWEDGIRMMFTIHDELVFEIKKDMLEEAVPFLRYHMCKFDEKMDWDVPIEVEVELGEVWDTPHEWNKFKEPSDDTGLAEEPVPDFLKPHVDFKRGMWYEDDDDGIQIWDGSEWIDPDDPSFDWGLIHEKMDDRPLMKKPVPEAWIDEIRFDPGMWWRTNDGEQKEYGICDGERYHSHYQEYMDAIDSKGVDVMSVSKQRSGSPSTDLHMQQHTQDDNGGHGNEHSNTSEEQTGSENNGTASDRPHKEKGPEHPNHRSERDDVPDENERDRRERDTNEWTEEDIEEEQDTELEPYVYKIETNMNERNGRYVMYTVRHIIQSHRMFCQRRNIERNHELILLSPRGKNLLSDEQSVRVKPELFEQLAAHERV